MRGLQEAVCVFPSLSSRVRGCQPHFRAPPHNREDKRWSCGGFVHNQSAYRDLPAVQGPSAADVSCCILRHSTSEIPVTSSSSGDSGVYLIYMDCLRHAGGESG